MFFTGAYCGRPTCRFGDDEERNEKNEVMNNNTLWTGVLVSLLFFVEAYYGLSKQANERIRGQEAHLEGAANPAHVAELSAGTTPVGGKVPANPDGESYPMFAPFKGSHEEEVSPALTFKQTEPPKFTMDTSQLNFDLFQILQRLPTKLKEANNWPKAPFVVSPPKLPVVMNGNAEGAQDTPGGDGGGVQLGYFQNPTVVDGTVVFSSEGDLYLTRLAETELHNMPAMVMWSRRPNNHENFSDANNSEADALGWGL